MSLDWTADVGEFHRHINYRESKFSTAVIASATQMKRVSYMQEELSEYCQGVAEADVGKAADAIIDLIYYAVGTLRAMGIDPRPVWDEVHKANMTKSSNPAAWKNCDKTDWRKPDIRGAIKRGQL